MSEDLKALDIKALAKKHTELAKKMLNLRFQQKMGQLENTSEHKKTRRQIARVLTEINHKKAANNNQKVKVKTSPKPSKKTSPKPSKKTSPKTSEKKEAKNA